ncbi:hypothetical protein DRW03_31195 [Corallococcus sp. H22C18031201]|nr:hypothetical protein DRW03_31195 [Corallococcus sp. H22C18031201]
MKNSLLNCILLVAASAVIASGCNGCGGGSTCDNSRIAQQGGCCRTDSATPCDGSLTCNNGACTPCGAAGQQCCNTGVTETCTAGLSCELQSSGLHTCNDCGGLNERCCQGNRCENTFTCNTDTNRCISAASVHCTGGANHYVIGVRDSQLCGQSTLDINADTPEQALECARTMPLPPGGTLIPAPAVLQTFSMCLSTTTMGVQRRNIRAFSDYDARQCALNTCENCTDARFDC